MSWMSCASRLVDQSDSSACCIRVASTACSAAMTVTSDSGVAGSSTLSEKDSVMRPKSSDSSTISMAGTGSQAGPGAGAAPQGQLNPALLAAYRSTLVSPRDVSVRSSNASPASLHLAHNSGLQLMPPTAGNAGDIFAGSKNNLFLVEGGNISYQSASPSNQLRPGGGGGIGPSGELSASAANLTFSLPPASASPYSGAEATAIAPASSGMQLPVARSSSASPAPTRVKRGQVPDSLVNASAVACALGTPPISPLAREDGDAVEMVLHGSWQSYCSHIIFNLLFSTYYTVQ